MKWFTRKQQQEVVGIDIGEHSLKLLQVRRQGDKKEIVHFRRLPTPVGAMEGEWIRDFPLLVGALRQLAEGLPPELPVATAVAGQSVFIRHFTLPVMKERELAVAVPLEAEAHLPIPVREVMLDFLPLGKVMEDGVQKQEVMVVAARTAVVEQLQQLFQQAGLNLQVMDVESMALARTAALFDNNWQAPERAVALADIGATTTTFSVYAGGVLRFTRTLPIGGERLTRALVDFFQMPWEEAENTKTILNLTGDLGTTGLTVLLHRKTEVVQQAIDQLVLELRRSLEFYQSRYRQLQVDKLYLSGGTAQMQGLASYLAEGLELPVETLNPLLKLDIAQETRSKQKEMEATGAALAVVAGLALSEVE